MDDSYPLKSTCSLSATLASQSNLMLRAWQLSLSSQQPTYSFPPDLPTGVFGIQWDGSITVTNGIDAPCLGDAPFGWVGSIGPGTTIELAGSETAEITVIGIVDSTFPKLDSPLPENDRGSIPFGAIDGPDIEAIIRYLDLDARPAEVIPQFWLRPCFVLRASDGPVVKAQGGNPFPINAGAGADDDPALKIVGISDSITLGFEDGESGTRAIVCDFSATGDPLGIVGGCGWRCKGGLLG